MEPESLALVSTFFLRVDATERRCLAEWLKEVAAGRRLPGAEQQNSNHSEFRSTL